MASPAHKQQPPNINFGADAGATSAPPPTPSALSNHQLAASSSVADAVSHLLHRLPPTLSLPSRSIRSRAAKSAPPVISLSNANHNDHLLSSSSQLGYFQLTDHNISSGLARSAESEARSLFELEEDKKESYFPRNWPLGYEAGEEEEEDGKGNGESFCLDSACYTESTELSLTYMREFTRVMEKVGLKIVEMMASAVGFDNPFGDDDPTRFCSLMWISQRCPHGDKPAVSGGFYPYIVGLHYQIRPQKYLLLVDSGSVNVSPQVECILVTLGDIAQVWSNGKLKKVRGKAVPYLGDGNSNDSHCISMSVLVTLPLDSRVSPLIPKLDHDPAAIIDSGDTEDDDDNNNIDDRQSHEGPVKKEDKRLFESFPFEDYAWRAYHERLLFKDPLDRYRIRNL